MLGASIIAPHAGSVIEGYKLESLKVERQTLHELLELRFGSARMSDRAKRVDDDDRRLHLFHLGEHALHDAVEIVLHRFGAEVHEAHRSADLRHVEKAVLLHVTQHLERRLTEDGEVNRRRFLRSSRKDDLLRQRGLARTRPPGDQVERILGQSPAEADMQRFFQVTSPSVHQMVLSLEKAGLITRQPGIARSITLTIDPADLPELASRYDQPVKIAVQSY